MTPLVEKSLNGITYWEMALGQVEAETPIALVLHWMGGNAASMRFVFEGYMRPLRVIFLQAPYVLEAQFGGGFTWFPDDEAFYQRSEADQAPDIRQQGNRVADFIRDLKALYPAKVAVLGMSQGGDLTLSLAAYHPELIDLAMPMAGRLSPDMRPAQAQAGKLPRIVLFQGVQDPIVPVESAREATAWLQSTGYDASLREFPDLKHEVEGMESDIQAILERL